MIETIFYTLPEYFAPALINDDFSGLEDSDIKVLKTFLAESSEERGRGHWSLNPDEEPGFSRYHDVVHLTGAANCLPFIWTKM